MKTSILKKVVALMMVLTTVAGTVLSSGCSIVTRGSDYCYRFLDYICNSEFDMAYEMIADSIKAPETEEERAARLKAEEEEKAERGQFWRDVFGLSKDDEAAETAAPEDGSEGTPDPNATVDPDMTPNPDGTIDPDTTPDPDETIDPDATPDPDATIDPDATPTPMATPVALQNGLTPNPETGEYPSWDQDPNATPTPEPTPEAVDTPIPEPTMEPVAKLSTDVDHDGDGYVPIPGIMTPPPSPTPTPVPTDTPDPRATANANATPVPEDEPADSSEPATTITKVGFVNKYQSIFDELMLTGIEYEATNVTDGEIVAIVNYTLTYHSERAGEDLTFDFEIRADRVEHRWMIDWSPSLIFPQMEWGDNLRVGVLQANRGEILCGGEAYAQNVNIITVFAVPSTIEDLDQFCIDVAAISELEITEEDVRKAIDNQRNDFTKIQTFFPDEIDLALQERILSVKGLAIDTANYGTQRFYPYADSLCHIIGYAGIISKAEKTNFSAYGDIRYNEETKRFETKETRYNGDSWIGKYGLETLYEDTLLGTNGRFTYIQDSKGGSRGMLYSQSAVDGMDLHLTIIPELQERLEDIVDTVVYDEGIHGCVIVLNPKTGAIQAITSWPGFDLNYLARGMPEDEWADLQNHPDNPLFNRATQGLYTPGSVFKLMTSAALLETNTMTVNDSFPEAAETIVNDTWVPSNTFLASTDGTTLGDNRDEKSPVGTPFLTQSNGHPIARVQSDSNPGPMNLSNSVTWSDNIFFSYAALRMGAKKFEDYIVNKLDWNTPITLEAKDTPARMYWVSTGDENGSWLNQADSNGAETIWHQDEAGNWVPLELNGKPVNLVLQQNLLYGMDVSTPQFYSTFIPQDEYDLAVTGYGQGQILMSPLQMACYASAYANDGVVMQPYLVDSIWHANGTDYSLVEQRQPQVYKRLIEKSTVDTIYPSLIRVCHDGTGRHMFNNYWRRGYTYSPGYELAGKTGTAELTNDDSRELAWFICWRDSDSATNEKVTEENARLICIMLEIDLTKPAQEWAQMKFDIARAMLKKDILNNDEVAETA